MRILKIVNSVDSGGVFNCEKQFLKELKEQNVEVDLVILGDGKNASEYELINPSFLKLPEIESFNGFNVNKIWKSIQNPINLRRSIIAHFKRTGYDAIIFRRQYYSVLAFFLGRHYKTNVFWHIPGVIKSKSLKRVYNVALRAFNIIPIANSKYTRTTLGTICKYVIYPGFDAERACTEMDASIYRKKFNIPDAAVVYGVAARIYPGKAQDLVIEGFIRSGAIQLGHYLIIAGKIVDQLFWNRIQNDFGAEFGNQIIYIKEIEDIKNFYASIDVLINGGKEAEAFGISVAEALGSGKPVIAYGLGGPVEMVIDNHNGWIVKNPTPGEYEKAFARSFLSKDELRVFGKRSNEQSKKFSVPINVTNLKKIIINEQQ